MIITELNLPPDIIVGPVDKMDLPTRSSGLHLSQIYGDLEQEIATKKHTPMPLVQLQTYRSAGFIWEHCMSQAMANALANDEWVRPEEFWLDGISGSPDLISLRDWRIGETKYTWKSSRGLNELITSGTGPFWVWAVQIKGYCHMINTNKARLFAFFVNGNYRDGYKPEWRTLDFEFTSLELRENWDMLKAHARKKGWL